MLHERGAISRKPLRSLTGCLRCRQRKLKCDETHPVCTRCARWKLDCVWPSEQKCKANKSEANATKVFLAISQGGRAAPLQCYQDGYLAAGYEGFRDDNERRLVESAVEFVRRYTCLGAGRGKDDMSFLTALVLQCSWSRFALSAFSAGAISRWDDRFKATALSSHQAAVVEMRFNLSSGSVRDSDVRLLTSIFFLGMMEYFAHGCPRAAFNHFSVVARAALVLHEPLSNSLQDASSRWLVTMINTSIILCANFFWIEPKIYILFEGRWDDLDAFISRCVQLMADTYTLCLPEAILRARVQLHTNRIIFDGPRPSHVRTALRYVDSVEEFITNGNPASLRLSSTNSDIGWRAEICAMRLYIAAVAGPAVCSNDQQLAAMALEWRGLNTRFLQSLNHSMPHTEILLPMTKLSMMNQMGIGIYYIPLLCIVHDLEWFEEIASVYNSLDVIIDSDVATRIQRMIQLIRKRKQTMDCTLLTDGKCSARHDGLDILRHPQGVLC